MQKHLSATDDGMPRMTDVSRRLTVASLLGAMATIDFYYDVVSPYSFIAFELLMRIAADHKNLAVNMKPFLLGGVMNSAGNVPPATVPAKGKYMPGDLKFLFEFFSIGTFKFPPKCEDHRSFANSTLFPDKVVPATRKFWNFYWLEQKNIDEEADVVKVLLQCGLSADDIARVVHASNDQVNKDLLRGNTEEAVAKGAFGAPIMVAKRKDGGEKIFFGQDRVQPMLYFLGMIPRARY